MGSLTRRITFCWHLFSFHSSFWKYPGSVAAGPFLRGGGQTSVASMDRKGQLGWACAGAVALLGALVREASAGPSDLVPSSAEALTAPADEDPDAEQAVLYTIGPGASVFERWGHSLLCFQPKGAFSKDGALKSPEVPNTPALIDTSCFDFGVFPRDPISRVVSGSMRGEALFVPREIAYQHAVGRYFWLDRTIERQVLPLAHEQVFDLRDRLNQVVLEEQAYPYHPFSNNCSSQLRDVLDAFSGGQLKPKGSKPTGPTLRTVAEEGFSGQMFSLLGLELFIGASADAPTTAWQRAAFPKGLKALLEDRLGARSHRVYEQSWKPLETSVHAGRGLLLILAVALCLALLWAARERGTGSKSVPGGNAWFRSVQVFGFLVAILGVLSFALRFYSVYPEFKSSWTPLIFFPLDAALPWMSPFVRQRYVGGRLLCVGLLAALSGAELLAQPLLPAAAFVALPMGIIGFVELRGTLQRVEPPRRNLPASGGDREIA